MTDYHVPATICWHCDRLLDGASPVEGVAEPEVGAISLCIYCGAIAVFDQHMNLRAPTEQELDVLRKDKEFMNAFVTFAYMRQYLLLKVKLLHEDEGPDR